MKILGHGPGSISDSNRLPRTAGDRSGTPAEEIKVGAVDRAEISSEGLSLAKQASESIAAEAGMDAAKFELIQARVESGFYTQPDVLDEVASRIVTSGDL